MAETRAETAPKAAGEPEAQATAEARGQPLAAEPLPTPGPLDRHVAIITGLSGAGKTATSKLFEDLGYGVVDNLPAELLAGLAELVASDGERFRRVAIVLDVRSGDAPTAFTSVVDSLHERGIEPQVFYLEANDDVLIRRFSETRHRHPLSGQSGTIGAAIASERRLLEPIRARADVVIDTSEMSGRQLRERIHGALRMDEPGTMPLHLVSFGFKHGLPPEADLVFDVRFMENPFYIERLRPLSGLTEPVREFVLGQPVTQRFLEHVREYFRFAIPAYRAEGKTRLTVGIGCTGGYHRSIAISEALAEAWRAEGLGPVSVWHRELERERA